MNENSTLNVSILVGVVLVIVRKVAKILQKRQSECGLSTPCFNFWVDLESNEPSHETSHETSHDTNLVPFDSLDFRELEFTLMNLIEE